MRSTRHGSTGIVSNIGGRIFLGFLLCGLLSACSTATLQSPVEARAKEYQELKETITQFHENASFGPDQPWLFSAKTTDQYYQDFVRKYCGTDSPLCSRQFDASVNNLLTRTYFAADLSQLQRKCAEDPLICWDLQTIEVLFRKLHNAGVQASEQEKLAKIEAWNRRKMTDQELESALHID